MRLYNKAYYEIRFRDYDDHTKWPKGTANTRTYNNANNTRSSESKRKWIYEKNKSWNKIKEWEVGGRRSKGRPGAR